MGVFKDHSINVKQLSGFISEVLIANLSLTTKIDHYAKVLHDNYAVIFCGSERNRNARGKTFAGLFYPFLEKTAGEGNLSATFGLMDQSQP